MESGEFTLDQMGQCRSRVYEEHVQINKNKTATPSET